MHNYLRINIQKLEIRKVTTFCYFDVYIEMLEKRKSGNLVLYLVILLF